MVTTHEGEIDISGLPEAARKAQICPQLARTSLVSIKTLIDAGGTVTFTKYKCLVQYEGRTIWRGQQEASKVLWILPLSPEGPDDIERLKISPQQWMSTVEQLNQEHQANNVYHATTKSELMKYLHQAAFSLVKATWKKAIENGQLSTWPGLTVEAVDWR